MVQCGYENNTLFSQDTSAASIGIDKRVYFFTLSHFSMLSVHAFQIPQIPFYNPKPNLIITFSLEK